MSRSSLIQFARQNMAPSVIPNHRQTPGRQDRRNRGLHGVADKEWREAERHCFRQPDMQAHGEHATPTLYITISPATMAGAAAASERSAPRSASAPQRAAQKTKPMT